MTPAAFLALASLVPALAGAQDAPVATLKDAFERALKASETIAVSEQSLRQAEALYRRARGSSLPEFSFVAGADWQDRPAGDGKAETESAFRAAWSGLNGYRELAAVRAAKSTAAQFEHARRRAEQLLLGDVAGAFFSLLQARENVLATEQLIELAKKRLAELRERVRVGRTRDADISSQDFQVATLLSQLEESRRQVLERSDLLSFLVRAPLGEPGVADALPAEKPLEAYLARLDDRPDVRAAREAEQSAESLVHLARAERLPQLGLQANYYAHRPSPLKETKWDASAFVGVPLWSWGALKAGVDEAKARSRARGLEHSAVRRLAELDIKNAYRDLASARRQLELRRQALEHARKDQELQARDERRGLISAFEGLESLNRLNGARLALSSALLGLRLASVNLDIASGTPPSEAALLR